MNIASLYIHPELEGEIYDEIEIYENEIEVLEPEINPDELEPDYEW